MDTNLVDAVRFIRHFVNGSTIIYRNGNELVMKDVDWRGVEFHARIIDHFTDLTICDGRTGDTVEVHIHMGDFLFIVGNGNLVKAWNDVSSHF